MCSLPLALRELPLRAIASSPLEEEYGDEPRLQEDDRQDAEDVPPVEPPERWRPEQDRAARGQTVLGDVPALSSRQSKVGGPVSIGGDWMLDGASPRRIRAATPAALTPSERSGWSLPPTIPQPIWLSKQAKTGALETALRRIKSLLPFE